mmetsp:Transcript_47938/g.138735  ORF Transcript_47938/g.138735 Transcript_47938/m.138735 type:complete len:129 (-) Transcript_47938:1540-1926(-)
MPKHKPLPCIAADGSGSVWQGSATNKSQATTGLCLRSSPQHSAQRTDHSSSSRLQCKPQPNTSFNWIQGLGSLDPSTEEGKACFKDLSPARQCRGTVHGKVTARVVKTALRAPAELWHRWDLSGTLDL